MEYSHLANALDGLAAIVHALNRRVAVVVLWFVDVRDANGIGIDCRHVSPRSVIYRIAVHCCNMVGCADDGRVMDERGRARQHLQLVWMVGVLTHTLLGNRLRIK